MKVRASVKRLCEGCKIVKRKNVVRVICKTTPDTSSAKADFPDPRPNFLMPRLLGVDIPGEKRIEASLPYIYGIGPSSTKRILEQVNIDPNTRAKDLSPIQINEIIQAISARNCPSRAICAANCRAI